MKSKSQTPVSITLVSSDAKKLCIQKHLLEKCTFLYDLLNMDQCKTLHLPFEHIVLKTSTKFIKVTNFAQKFDLVKHDTHLITKCLRFLDFIGNNQVLLKFLQLIASTNMFREQKFHDDVPEYILQIIYQYSDKPYQYYIEGDQQFNQVKKDMVLTVCQFNTLKQENRQVISKLLDIMNQNNLSLHIKIDNDRKVKVLANSLKSQRPTNISINLEIKLIQHNIKCSFCKSDRVKFKRLIISKTRFTSEFSVNSINKYVNSKKHKVIACEQQCQECFAGSLVFIAEEDKSRYERIQLKSPLEITHYNQNYLIGQYNPKYIIDESMTYIYVITKYRHDIPDNFVDIFKKTSNLEHIRQVLLDSIITYPLKTHQIAGYEIGIES